MSSREGAGSARVRAKLKLAVEQKNFYEAHQMYRTLYFRLQRRGGSVDELLSLLVEGSQLFFDHQQTLSAVDLLKCLLEVLPKQNVKPVDKHFGHVVKLYLQVPRDSPDRDQILASALKWSSSSDGAEAKESSNGHPRLHQILAHSLWAQARYAEARHHFLYACDGDGCGSMLAEYHSALGFNRELDLFIAATVLQLLCLRKHIVAALALKAYTSKHPKIKRGPPYLHPLLNFIWLLVLAIEQKRSVTTFSVLVDHYKASIDRDPTFLSYLNNIGELFFGLPPVERSRPSGLMSGIFDSFLNAMNDDDDEDEQDQQRSQSHQVNQRMETEDLD